MVSFADDFNRANGSVGTTNYDTLSTIPLPNIESNVVVAVTGDATGNYAVYKTALATTHTGQIDYDLGTATGTSVAGVATRFNGTAITGFVGWIRYNGSIWDYGIERFDGGGATILITAPTSAKVAGTLRFESVGNVHTLYDNNIQVLTWTDATYNTATKVGFFNRRASGTALDWAVDNFSTTDVPATPTITSQAGGHTRAGVEWAPGFGLAVTDWDIDWATAAAPTTWLGPVATGSTNPWGAVTGLTNGTAYVFRVRGENATGVGAWSATSGSATPSDVRGSLLLENGDKFLLENGDEFLLESGAGDVSITGTAAVTLAPFVPAASGTYTPAPITGTVAVTLASFTSSASGTTTPPAFTGTVAVTLAPFAPAGTGDYTPPPITGTVAVTLASFVSAASGSYTPPEVTGTSAVTLASFTAAGSGTYTPAPITGTTAVTLASFVSAASGTSVGPGAEGTAAVTLDPFVAAGTGAYTPPPVTGTSDVTLASFVAAGSGTATPPAFTGTAAVTLEPFTSTASGTYTPPAFTGTVAVTLASFTSTASGTSTPPAFTGTVAVTLANFTTTTTGTYTPPPITGTVAKTLGNFTSTASGTVGTIPEAPTVVRPTDAFGYSLTVDLTYTAPAGTIISYDVETSINYKSSWQTYGNVGNDTTPTLTGLTVNQRYDFRVRAINAVGAGPWAEAEWGSTPVLATAAQNPPADVTSATAREHLLRIDKRTIAEQDGNVTRDWSGAGVVLYVPGSGIRSTHNEFAGRVATGHSFDQATYPWDQDTANHDTGVISDAIGLTLGVANGATICSVRVWIDESVGPSDVIDGLEWIRDNHETNFPGQRAVIASSTAYAAVGADENLAAVNALLDDFFDMGITFVQMTGNSGEGYTQIQIDVDSPGVLHVGGITDGDAVWSSTLLTEGRIDVFAHSEAVDAAQNSSNSAIAEVSGTSFATPQVGGYVCMLLHANPLLTPAQCKDLVVWSSTKDLITGDIDDHPNRILYIHADVPPVAHVGTVARTLGNFTSSASGTATPPAFTGTVARTLGSFTAAASGSYTPPPVTGTAAVTLASFTTTTSGTHTPPSFTGTAASTLDPFVAAGTGSYTPAPITGTTAATLAPFTAAASGTSFAPGSDGTAAITLAPFVAAATGAYTPPPVTGTSAVTLAPFTSSATGTAIPPAFTGTGSSTLAPFTSSATGNYTPPTVTGTAAVTLQPFQPSATGTFTPAGITGTGTPTLGTFTASGIGVSTPLLVGGHATGVVIWRDGGTGIIGARDSHSGVTVGAHSGTGSVNQP